jgi:hypothetical protein
MKLAEIIKARPTWPPYALLEESIEERARARLDKLERI